MFPSHELRNINDLNSKPVVSAFPKVFSCPEFGLQKTHYLPADKLTNAQQSQGQLNEGIHVLQTG